MLVLKAELSAVFNTPKLNVNFLYLKGIYTVGMKIIV